METVVEVIKSDAFFMVMLAIMLILLIGFITLTIKFSKLHKKYKDFMIKLGNGKSLEEDLETYMYRVNKVEQENANLGNQVENIEKDLKRCIHKVGLVRYNAFQDVGSDLSFALALLDENNDGIVLNGIYAREMSNIYAKPIEKGKSSYVVSEEEAKALQKAMEQ